MTLKLLAPEYIHYSLINQRFVFCTLMGFICLGLWLKINKIVLNSNI